MSALTTGTATNLVNLAEQINREHEAAGVAAQKAVEHAIRAGRLLIEAKTHVEHGGWGAWLQEHFQGSARTAQGYMRIASRLPELESKTQRVAFLPLREALALLAEPKPAPAPNHPADVKKLFPVLIPPPGHTLYGQAGDSTAIIENSPQGNFFYVTAIHWGHAENGYAEGTKKPIPWNLVNDQLHRLAFDWHAAEWTVVKSEEPKKYNQWLFDSHQEYVQRHVLTGASRGLSA